MWLKLRGNVQTGSRAAGTLLLPDVTQGCVTTATSDIAGPTWAPRGTALAWYEQGAIHVWDDVSRCAGASSKPVIPGGSEPDWGPADVNPGPREGEVPPPGPPAPAPAAPKPGDGKPPAPKPSTPQGTAKPKLRLAATVRLRTALRRGFRVRVSGAERGTIALVAKQGKRKLASGKAKVPASGRVTVTLRFTTAAKLELVSRKRVSVVVSGRGATRTVTLKR